jgi:hypothetical protein
MCGAQFHGGAQIIRGEQTVDQAGREAIATTHAVIDLQSSTGRPPKGRPGMTIWTRRRPAARSVQHGHVWDMWAAAVPAHPAGVLSQMAEDVSGKTSAGSSAKSHDCTLALPAP